MPDEQRVRPGVVVMTRFIAPGAAQYQGYIDYIDRDEATRLANANKYDLYVTDYMDNPAKTRQQSSDPGAYHAATDDDRMSDLFTASADRLTADEKKTIKKQFQIAQKNGSPLWQTIINFDNEWLQECGALSPDGRALDETILREATRRSMAELLRREKMEISNAWTASIHYNTDNIHVHIATVQPHPTRPTIQFGGQQQYRGKFRQATMDAAKSRVVNTISDQTLHLAEINNTIRQNIVAHKLDRPLSHNQLFAREYRQIFRQLPPDRRRWHYGDRAMDGLRDQIDQFTARYIARYNQADLDDLNRMLDAQQTRLQRAYGTGKDNRYADYKQTKLRDLQQRLGNAVLAEMREDARRMDAAHDPRAARAGAKLHTAKLLNESCRDLKRAFKKTFDSVKNQRDFAQLQQTMAADLDVE